jgi:hypothetical protein
MKTLTTVLLWVSYTDWRVNWSSYHTQTGELTGLVMIQTGELTGLVMIHILES